MVTKCFEEDFVDIAHFRLLQTCNAAFTALALQIICSDDATHSESVESFDSEPLLDDDLLFDVSSAAGAGGCLRTMSCGCTQDFSLVAIFL